MDSCLPAHYQLEKISARARTTLGPSFQVFLSPGLGPLELEIVTDGRRPHLVQTSFGSNYRSVFQFQKVLLAPNPAIPVHYLSNGYHCIQLVSKIPFITHVSVAGLVTCSPT